MKITDDYETSIAKELFSAEEIGVAIARLAREIAEDHRRLPVTLLGVLKGALYVSADLSRAISAIADGPAEIVVDYISVSSYGNAARSSGEVRLLKDASEPITGRHVVIVEDIIDNGLTLAYLRALLGERNPASLRACVLFDKPYHRLVDVPLEYVGLQVPEEFVVGYGLDYQEMFRNLPYLAQLRPEVFLEG
ncbi:MAG TPA: hypoxanthine phosphoribosyltransferase [Candidatus Baltobacteraceae bacterium]|nr:hypoxanthine phosphoribosyltransferase [Candidatus Baltobacteraceae bacterium]